MYSTPSRQEAGQMNSDIFTPPKKELDEIPLERREHEFTKSSSVQDNLEMSAEERKTVTPQHRGQSIFDQEPNEKNEGISVEDQLAPEFSDTNLYPEPDLMRRYSVTRARAQTISSTHSNAPSLAQSAAKSSSTSRSDGQNGSKGSKNSKNLNVNPSMNPLFEGKISPSARLAAANSTKENDSTSLNRTLKSIRSFTSPILRSLSVFTGTTNNVSNIPSGGQTSDRDSSRGILKISKSSGGPSKSSGLDSGHSEERSPSVTFQQPQYRPRSHSDPGGSSGEEGEAEKHVDSLPFKRSKQTIFSPVTGPLERRLGKHSSSNTPSPASPEMSSPKTTGLMSVLARAVQFDSGFSTVYSADRPRVVDNTALDGFSPSERSEKTKESHDSAAGAVGGEESPNYLSISPIKKSRQKFQSSYYDDNNKSNSNGLYGIRSNLKAALEMEDPLHTMALGPGLDSRQEGGMDYDSALLIVLMDPNHPHGQSFHPTSSFDEIYDIALKANEMELERLSAELTNDHPDVIVLKQATSDLYKGLDMPIAAEVLLRQVIDSQKRVYGEDAFEVISSMNDLGLLLLSTRRYSEAQKIFEEVVTSVCRNQGETHPDAAAALGNLAIALRLQSNFANAVPVHERAVQILEKTVELGRDHPDTVYQRAQMGITFILMGAEQKGRRLVNDSVLKLSELHNFDSNHPWILSLSSILT